MGERELDAEALRAEDDLCNRTIPYRDRVLVKLDQAEVGMTSGGIHEVERQMKYSKECVEGTVIRAGKRALFAAPGDKVWLDRKTWVPGARYVIIRERDILACETPDPIL